MEQEEKNYILLKEFILERGISLFGVADITLIKQEFLLDSGHIKNLTRGISIGFRLLSKILEGIKDRPTKLYHHHYRQVNFLLDRVSLTLSSFIQNQGWEALPIPASQIVDWEHQKAHLSHKKVGQLAGLGWIGRNNLLVNPKLGAQFRLATILTNMPLLTDNPARGDCSNCRKCIAVCPIRAIKEKPEDFDHLGCFGQLKIFRKEGISNQYICGVCVKACSGKK
ncbi:MAG: hypothetical protein ACE5WD_08510 [Candidatus Aminicenantia bacterium]